MIHGPLQLIPVLLCGPKPLTTRSVLLCKPVPRSQRCRLAYGCPSISNISLFIWRERLVTHTRVITPVTLYPTSCHGTGHLLLHKSLPHVRQAPDAVGEKAYDSSRLAPGGTGSPDVSIFDFGSVSDCRGKKQALHKLTEKYETMILFSRMGKM